MFASSAYSVAGDGSHARECLAASKKRLFLTSTHVVLGGGAIYGLTYIGALMELCNYNEATYARWTETLKAVAGTSAGTVVGIMMAAGVNPWRMRDIVHKSGLSRVMESMLDISLKKITQGNAVSSGEKVDEVAKDLVHRLTGSRDTTFRQFYESTRRNFVMVVTNGTTSMAEFWNHESKPNLELWRGIRCSTSIPGVFAPPIIDNVAYFDGGVTCNLPCHLFPPCTTLSLFVHTLFKTQSYSTLLSTVMHSLAVYMSSSQLGAMRMSHTLAFRAVPCAVSSADTGVLGPYAFDVSTDLMDALIEDGCRSVRAVLTRDALVAVLLLLVVLSCSRKRGSSAL
jgi:predicted acylesterase/phospholipase RssA